MVEPRSTEDDNLVPELPRSDGGLDGEENFQPLDDSDLGLDDEGEVGLDAEPGLDEPLAADEIDDLEDDPASWLDDGKEPPALADDDADLEAEDEVNLTEGSEPASEQVDDWEDDFGFDDRVAAESDGGEEGFGDDSLLVGFELDQLPPLDDSAAGDDDALEAQLFAEALAELDDALEEDAGEELVPGLRCTRIAGARVTVDALRQSARPLARLVAAGAGAVAWDGSSLLLAEAGAQAAQPCPEALGPVHAMASAGAVIALATPAGLLCSRDFGRSFARAAGAPGAALPSLLSSLAITVGRGGPRIWASGADGRLFVSDDGGERFRLLPLPLDARAVRLCSDGAGTLAVLARSERGAVVLCARSGDAFEAVELPVSEVERVQDLQVASDTLLCCRRAPLPQLCWRHAGAWSEQLQHAAPPALLLREGGTVRLYFWVRAEHGARHLVRSALGTDALPEIVAELPGEAGAPLQLCGHHDAGVTTLHAGAERGLYRLVVRAEGSPR